jgi:hypothetical protein
MSAELAGRPASRVHPPSRMNDEDPYFERALQKYREESGDLRDFADLESDLQEAIRHRSQRLKDELERQKRG